MLILSNTQVVIIVLIFAELQVLNFF